MAALILTAVAVGYGVLAWQEQRLSPVQMHTATAALREHDPSLFRHDPYFSDAGLRSVHSPLYQGLVRLGLRLSGYRDPLLAFRLLAPLVALLYLGSMYVLLYRHCRSWSVAVFVAVISSMVTDTLGPAYWGIGPLDTMGPSAFLQALAPLIVLGFLRLEAGEDGPSRRRLALVFALIGLLGNLSPAWAMNLTLVLVVVYLGRRHFALRALPRAIGYGLAALVCILPYLVYFIDLRLRLAAPQAGVSGGMVFEAIRLINPEYLYPDMPKSLLNWVLLAGLLVVPAVLVLGRYERYRSRDLAFWLLFSVGALGLALVLQGCSQLLGYLTGKGPPTIEFLHASSLAMIGLYVLFAQTVANVFRLVREHQNLLRLACGVMAAVWMIPADNLRPVRHAAVDTLTMFMDETDKPEFIRSRHEDSHRRRELAEISAWAAANTPPDAVFVTDLADFRLAGRRAIVGSAQDLRFVYALAPWRVEEFVLRLQDLGRVLGPKETGWPARARQGGDLSRAPAGKPGKVDVEALRLLVDGLAEQSPLALADHWYVIVRASVAPETSAVLERVPQPTWGRFYRVYKLSVPAR